MSKIKSTLFAFSRHLQLLACGAVTVVMVLSGLGITASIAAHADQYDDKINALSTQNASTQGLVNSLQAQAASYQDAISQLQGQIAGLQAALSVNETQQASLQQQITDAQNNIIQKKKLLGAEITSLYEDGQMTTIEELATSKNLSDYVDKQEYSTTVQNKIDALIQQIGAQEAQMQTQKSQLDIVIKTEQQQNDQLASDQARQQTLLAYTEGQQAAYNQQIASNQQQIASLRAQQIAANRKLVSNGGGQVISSGSCGGSYPADAINGYGGHWGCDYSLDNTIDNWGMYNRECVSYTAWMVYKTYGYMPYWGGVGNANEWPANARAAGIATGSTPKVGSVAIYMGGSGDPFGHAMWVTAVNGNMITVQQYNLYYDGNYYVTTISASGLTYIYFGG
jgi:surface antigen/peptidoglycan hydrolase CwlO-like protein